MSLPQFFPGRNPVAKLLWPCFVIVVTAISLEQSCYAEAQLCSPPPPYWQLRYDEDYSYLRNQTCFADIWDNIKYVPLTETGMWIISPHG
jgi:hypothetical protein